MNKGIRQAVASLRKARSAASWVTCLAHVTYALRQLDPRTAQSAFRKGLGAAHKAKAEGKIQKRLNKTERVRKQVMARPGPDCELGEHSWPRDSIDMHHLKAGSAKHFTESVRNCVRACRYHHDDFHLRGAEKYRAVVTRLCRRFRYRLPSVYTRGVRGETPPSSSPVEHAAVPRRSANV